MVANGIEWNELAERILRLPAAEQVALAQHVLAGIRQRHFTDYEAVRAEYEAMLAFESAQRQARQEGAAREAG